MNDLANMHPDNWGQNELSLTDAFRRFVIQDPEVAALSRRVTDTHPKYDAVFRDGLSPDLMGDYHWALDATGASLAYKFVSLPISYLNGSDPEPSAEMSAVADALADRIMKFRDLLISGHICAFGTSTRTEVEVPIGRMEWARRDISIEVYNGDLCDGQDYRARPRWTGIALRGAEAARLPRAQFQPIDRDAAAIHAAEPQVQNKPKCERECVDWLDPMMRASPNGRTRSKDELWAEAQSRWPKKLSRRAFDRAWTEATNRTGALAWSAAGRTRKSPH